jgi:predicted secreted Zn-dependent protease
MGWGRVLAVSVLVLAGRSTVSAQLLPPEERGRALSSAEAGPPSIPGVHVRSVEEFYELDEPTLTQVVARLNHTHLEGPDAPRSQGLTRFNIRPEWNAVARGGRCRVREVEVFVQITVTLPRWSPIAGQPAAEQGRWSSIEQAIRQHEYRHRDLVILAAATLLESIGNLEAQGCTTLRQVVASTLSVADSRLTAAHAEVDRSTPYRLAVGD